MHYVILRDDDTNAFTPVACLERLYRPFLERGLPVNLAVIPQVSSTLRTPDGRPEGFLFAREDSMPSIASIGSNDELVNYLRQNDGYRIVQHGCHHDPFEFDRKDREDVTFRMEYGAELLLEAGFKRPLSFVAPHDKWSPISFLEAARRFSVLSTGWFELRRLPVSWWPQYVWKKARHASHWRVGQTALLSHPGCLLSYVRKFDTMLDSIKRTVEKKKLTVLVTHWWEYFHNHHANEDFIKVLHQTAGYLAGDSDIQVISFDDLAGNEYRSLVSEL